MSLRFTVQIIVACVMLTCREGFAAPRETDTLMLAQLKGLTSVTGDLQGDVVGFEKQLNMVADACIKYPQLRQDVDRLIEEAKSNAGNQKQQFLDLFAEATCNKARDCALAAELKAQGQQIRDLQDAVAENSPTQVLPAPPPSFDEGAAAPELPPVPVPHSQRKVWTWPVHQVIARPASGVVTFNQPFTLIDTCVDVSWPNGMRAHGNMYQLADGQNVLVTHGPRVAYQSALAVR